MNAAPPTVVLDTNVVLDWLFFADPRTTAIAQAIESRRLRWVATRAMRDELLDVLGRDPLQGRRPGGEHLLPTLFDTFVQMRPETTVHAAASAPRCRDPADQKFVDLAVGCAARWLLTRDRALLDLRAPAARLGVQILAPSAWSPSHAVEAAREGGSWTACAAPPGPGR